MINRKKRKRETERERQTERERDIICVQRREHEAGHGGRGAGPPQNDRQAGRHGVIPHPVSGFKLSHLFPKLFSELFCYIKSVH